MAATATREDGKVWDALFGEWVTPWVPKPALAIKVGDLVQTVGIGRGHDGNGTPYVGRVRAIYQVIGQAYLRASVDVPEWGIPLTVPLAICDVVRADTGAPAPEGNES